MLVRLAFQVSVMRRCDDSARVQAAFVCKVGLTQVSSEHTWTRGLKRNALSAPLVPREGRSRCCEDACCPRCALRAKELLSVADQGPLPCTSNLPRVGPGHTGAFFLPVADNVPGGFLQDAPLNFTGPRAWERIREFDDAWDLVGGHMVARPAHDVIGAHSAL